MKPSAATRDSCWDRVIYGALFLSLGLSLYSVFSKEGYGRQILAATTGHAPPLAENFLQIDRLFANAPTNGNVCLVFHGFSLADESSVEMAYFRSRYRLFPRKVLVAPAGTVINRGRDILNAQFDPTRDWLVQHQVSFLVDFVRQADGSVTFNQFTISQ